MFLVPGLPFLVIVTVHYKEIRVFRESWQNHGILEELVILHLCNQLLWIHHENNYSGLGLSLTGKLSYCVIRSQPFETDKAVEVT